MSYDWLLKYTPEVYIKLKKGVRNVRLCGRCQVAMENSTDLHQIFCSRSVFQGPPEWSTYSSQVTDAVLCLLMGSGKKSRRNKWREESPLQVMTLTCQGHSYAFIHGCDTGREVNWASFSVQLGSLNWVRSRHVRVLFTYVFTFMWASGHMFDQVS